MFGYSFGHSFLDGDLLKLDNVVLKSIHQQFLEFFDIEAISYILHHRVDCFLVLIELPKTSF